MEARKWMYLFSDTNHTDYDLAAANLMAAIGLKGAEDLDVGHALNWLDSAAKEVHIETLRHSYQFRDQPDDFDNSPAYFCMLAMVTVLRHQFGVRYNPMRIRDAKFQDPNCFAPDFSDSRDLFIHGMIGGPGGTCASMPVLYVAVGRRLGYPLRLVQAKGHLFVRWDDPHGSAWPPGARFNIEATSEGLLCPSDDHYLTWPVSIGEKELAAGIYLRPLTAKEEVAMFRSTRAICLWENGRYADALRECHLAVVLAPHQQQYSWQIMDFYKQYRKIMLTKTPDQVAEFGLTSPEEISLQQNIARGHFELLRSGKPGYDPVAFGIYPNPVPSQEEIVPSLLIQPEPKRRSPMTPAMDRSQSPAVQSAVKQMEQAKRQNNFNRENRARLQRGLPGLNSINFDL